MNIIKSLAASVVGKSSLKLVYSGYPITVGSWPLARIAFQYPSMTDLNVSTQRSQRTLRSGYRKKNNILFLTRDLQTVIWLLWLVKNFIVINAIMNGSPAKNAHANVHNAKQEDGEKIKELQWHWPVANGIIVIKIPIGIERSIARQPGRIKKGIAKWGYASVALGPQRT